MSRRNNTSPRPHGNPDATEARAKLLDQAMASAHDVE